MMDLPSYRPVDSLGIQCMGYSKRIWVQLRDHIERSIDLQNPGDICLRAKGVNVCVQHY